MEKYGIVNKQHLTECCVGGRFVSFGVAYGHWKWQLKWFPLNLMFIADRDFDTLQIEFVSYLHVYFPLKAERRVLNNSFPGDVLTFSEKTLFPVEVRLEK